MQRKAICFFLLLLLLLGSSTGAERRVFISAETTRYLKDNIIRFENGVEIRYEDMVVTAITGEYYEDEEELLLKEDVEATQEKNRIRSPEMWMDLEEEHIIFRGGRVESLFYFQQEEEGEEEMPVEMWSDTLEIWQQRREMLAKGEVKAYYDDMDMEADEVLIEEEKDLLTATGNVYVLRDDGSWFRAEKVEYNLEDGTFVAYKMESEFELQERESP